MKHLFLSASHVYLTESDHAKLKALAAGNGMSVSSLLRQIIEVQTGIELEEIRQSGRQKGCVPANKGKSKGASR